MENEIWGEISLQPEQIYYYSFWDLHLWIKYVDDEIWIAHTYQKETIGDNNIDPGELPAGVQWSRWANKNINGKINILPIFPDLPLVVNVEYALKISANTKIEIFTRIPVWVSILLDKNKYKLIELPTLKLSRTWFGSPVEGELCYNASTKARRNLSAVKDHPYLASCPIIIHNNSYEELNFEKFCYRVERLSIYKHANTLWADETKIEYRGEEQHSSIHTTGSLPEGIQKKQLISKPRLPIRRSLATRTFMRFLQETQIIGK